MSRRTWTRKLILAAIRAHRSGGLSVKCSQVKKDDIALYSAACYYFRSWASALEAAGISVSKPMKWHKAELVRILRRLDRDGKFVGGANLEAESKRLGRDIRSGIKTFFGTLRAAREQLGIAALEPPVYWTQELVTQEIRSLAKDGSLRYTLVERSNRRLQSAIARAFGGWRAGLKAAGVTAGTKWTRSEVLHLLRSAWEERDIRIDSLKARFGGGIYIAAVGHFGSWQSALKSAGVPFWAYKTRMASRRAFWGVD